MPEPVLSLYEYMFGRPSWAGSDVEVTMQVKEVWCPGINSDISAQTDYAFGPAKGGDSGPKRQLIRTRCSCLPAEVQVGNGVQCACGTQGSTSRIRIVPSIAPGSAEGAPLANRSMTYNRLAQSPSLQNRITERDIKIVEAYCDWRRL
jgi:hypothetical protein